MPTPGIQLSKCTKPLLNSIDRTVDPHGSKIGAKNRMSLNPLFETANRQKKAPARFPPKPRAPTSSRKPVVKKELAESDNDREPESSGSELEEKLSRRSSPRPSSQERGGLAVQRALAEVSNNEKRRTRSRKYQGDSEPTSSEQFGSGDSQSGEKRKIETYAVFKNESDEEDLKDEEVHFTGSQRRPKVLYSSQNKNKRSITTNIHGEAKLDSQPPKPSKPELQAFKAPPSWNDDHTSFESRTLKTRNDETDFSRDINFPSFKDPSRLLDSATDELDPSISFLSDDDDSPLSTPPSSPSLHTPCPVCDDLVLTTLLSSFADGRKLRFKDQARFCQHHRTEKAKEQWTSQDYPTIDWATISKRLPRYTKRLDAVLDTNSHSFYRKVVEDEISNAGKKLRKVVRGLALGSIPGYYGPRGAHIMMAHLTTTYRAKVTTLGRTDKIVSMMDTSGYIRAVLLPELAAMLVQEDMDVDEGRARTIVEESAEIGALMNPEDEDVVTLEDDGTDGGGGGVVKREDMDDKDDVSTKEYTKIEIDLRSDSEGEV